MEREAKMERHGHRDPASLTHIGKVHNAAHDQSDHITHQNADQHAGYTDIALAEQAACERDCQRDKRQNPEFSRAKRSVSLRR